MSRAVGRYRAFLVAVATLTGGCTHLGEYVWIDAYKQPPVDATAAYAISPGDLISVRVWNQEAMSARVRVRADGMISLPFVNDVQAAGLEPSVLARRLQTRLKEFIVNPVVTIALEDAAPLEISVLGEVSKPGVYRMEQNVGVLNVLAAASGLTQYAARDRIFVLRRTDPVNDAAPPLRIRFTYEALSRVEGSAAKFRVRKGDVVVVE